MATPGTGTNHSLPQTPEGFGSRRKRKQVSRACDSCRIQRIKCDDSSPCLNCRTRGRRCSNTGTNKPSSLPQAINEIERLKLKVKELENQLQRERSGRVSSSESQQEEAPPPLTTPTPRSTEIQPTVKTKYWDGIHIRPARSSDGAWLGPSSLCYFTHRLGTFLNSQADNMLVHLASNLEPLGQPTPPDDSSRLLAPLAEINNAAVYLTSIQEGYFISLFWQTYHTSLYAVLDEACFNSHYQSLYVNVPPGNSRRPSSLVDIVIAMCMQYGTSKLPRGEQGNLEDNDATMAGRWYYRRAQALLACEVQSPSISTLQCQLLCAAYVCGGSFHNMADSISGLAVRTAYMLGLHIDPPPSMPEPERQLRRRLWWSVFELDTQVGLKLGRPFLVQDSHAMPELPSDSLEAAILSGSTFAPVANDTTWLSFNLHRVKLHIVARTIHNAIYGHDLGLANGKTVYEHPDRLEGLANTIYPRTKHLEDWIQEIPSGLKTGRKEQGNPFSMDGSLLDIEKYAPNWLQRQRLLLELEYYHICANLSRPFISFTTHQVPGCRGYEMAGRTASHATEFCNIAHQIISSTPLLHGCHQVFQWQWNAAMTLVGFVVAYPQHALTPAARGAIKLAISALETFGTGFEAAAKAAIIVRTLSSNLDSIMDGLEARMSNSTTESNGSVGAISSSQVMDGDLNINSNTTIDVDLFDMALGVDFWAGMDVL